MRAASQLFVRSFAALAFPPDYQHAANHRLGRFSPSPPPYHFARHSLSSSAHSHILMVFVYGFRDFPRQFFRAQKGKLRGCLLGHRDHVRLQIGAAVYRMIRQRITHPDLLELAFADLPSNKCCLTRHSQQPQSVGVWSPNPQACSNCVISVVR